MKKLYIVRDYWTGYDIARFEDLKSAIEYSKQQEGTEVLQNGNPIFWNIDLPF
jgi:hypothetical protein